jgi:hypothetical protein
LFEERGSISRWLARHAEEVQAAVRSTGAALLRGFSLADPHEFSHAASSFAGPLGGAYEGPSPRRALAPGVYTASEVWSALVVAEHAEMSYLSRMPRHLFFWCRQPSARGGATTLVYGRRVLARLDPRRIEPLLSGPLRIRRRHARPSGLRDPFELKPWPSLFGTDDRDLARQRAEELGYEVRFAWDGALTLEQSQPAVRHHPVSGEPAWLNHLLVFHGSSVTSTLASAFRSEGGLRAGAGYPLAMAYRALCKRGYPSATDVRLADGAPIDDDVVAHVREAVAAETVPVAWQRGDLLIVDNHVCLHGRRPYVGSREVIVAWSEARA